MKSAFKMVVTITIAVVSQSALADVGPFICSCEHAQAKDLQGPSDDSILIVTNLSTGQEFRLGHFTGTNFFKTAAEGQASSLCVEALKAQAVCRLGKAAR